LAGHHLLQDGCVRAGGQMLTCDQGQRLGMASIASKDLALFGKNEHMKLPYMKIYTI